MTQEQAVEGIARHREWCQREGHKVEKLEILDYGGFSEPWSIFFQYQAGNQHVRYVEVDPHMILQSSIQYRIHGTRRWKDPIYPEEWGHE